MADKYVEKQIVHLAHATSEDQKSDILYRIGTHLEVIPCDSNPANARENWNPILNAAYKAINEDASTKSEEE